MTVPLTDDDIIIDPSLLVEPDESEELDEILDGNIDVDQQDQQELLIEWEEIVDDDEFDEDREDIYEAYEEDPSLLEEDSEDA